MYSSHIARSWKILQLVSGNADDGKGESDQSARRDKHCSYPKQRGKGGLSWQM